MSAEPALMSLTRWRRRSRRAFVVARGDASCLDRIAQWQSRLNAFMAIDADEALEAADAADAALAKGGHRGALHGVPLAHKDMYYEAGKVVTCGSRNPARFRRTTTSTALRRLKDAGTIRLGTLQLAEFAYGPTGHNAHYGRCIIRGASIASPAGRRPDRARRSPRADLPALGSDTAARSDAAHFCGVRLKTRWDGSAAPAPCTVAVARHRRAAGAHRGGLRIAAGADGGRGPEDPTAATGRCRITSRRRSSRQGPDDRPAAAFYVDDLDPRSRDSRGNRRRPQARGRDIIGVELPDQRQLTAACQLVLAVEATAFHNAG